MPRTPDAYDGPRLDEAIIWDEQPSDPADDRRLQYVAGKGLVILEDGVVHAIGEGRRNYLQPPVHDQHLNDPPGSPTSGDRYIVGTAPTGAWVGHARELTQWNGSEWVFSTPQEGTIVYICDENNLYKQVNDSAPWSWVVVAGGGGSLPPATQVGEVLYSVDGSTFTVQHPLTAESGWLVNDEGILLVVG